VGGNFYGVTPYEGRYDALTPTFFSFTNNKPVSSGQAFSSIDGEIRDAKWLSSSDGNKLLVIARNNNSLIFLKQKKE
jgi:hypothetical protein